MLILIGVLLFISGICVGVIFECKRTMSDYEMFAKDFKYMAESYLEMLNHIKEQS